MERFKNLKILDINVASLEELLYTEVKGMNSDSLEKLLYIFVCDDKAKRDEIYKGDEIMKKVNEKVDALTQALDEALYYDRDEYFEEQAKAEACKMAEEKGEKRGEEKGEKKGHREEKEEIAKNMLKENTDIDFIIRVTGLTLEEINELKENNDK